MRTLNIQPSLADQVVDAIVADIVDGELPSNTRLIQDDLARAYGVSRQPVQQALLLLRNYGLIRDAPGRGLIVAPLDVSFVRSLYEVRAGLEGLAARLASERNPERARKEGPDYISRGRSAVESGLLSDRIAADIAFHGFLTELSENSVIAETVTPRWPYLRRVMAEVLQEDVRMPAAIWDEHEAILHAVIKGDGTRAETLSQQHISRAAKVFVERLQAQQDASNLKLERRRARRVLR